MRKLKKIDDLGFNLKEERTRLQWSQRIAAKNLGVSYITYQNWENGLTKFVTPRNFDNIKSVFRSANEAV